jgi:hypothetical protein
MNEEIKAETTLDVPNTRTAYGWHLRADRWRRASHFFLPFILVAGLIHMLTSKVPDPVDGVVLVGLPLFAMAVFLLEKRIVERSVKSSPAFGSKVQYQFDENSFALQTPGTQSSSAWTQVLETKLTPDGALIYLQRLMFYWVPRTAFASETDYNRFREFISAKTNHSVIS